MCIATIYLLKGRETSDRVARMSFEQTRLSKAQRGVFVLWNVRCNK